MRKCYDEFGKVLLWLTQWDLNRTITIRNCKYKTTPIIHFAHIDDEKSLVVTGDDVELVNGNLKINVPNILLQSNENIVMNIFVNLEEESKGINVDTIIISVQEKPQPNNYIYEDNVELIELSTLKLELQNAIKKAQSDVNEAIKKLDFNYEKILNKPQINSIELVGNKSLEDLNIQEKLTADNLKTVGGESLLGTGDINFINDNVASNNTTYSSNKILSLFGNILNIQTISTEDEFADFLKNMNTHTLYLVNNAIFGYEYYEPDCYIEIIVTEVGENFQYEIVGSTALSLQAIEGYTYSKEELNNYGVTNIPSPLWINNYELNNVFGAVTRYRSIKFLDENNELIPLTAKNNVVEIHFPISKGKKYLEKTNIQIHRSNPFNITLEHNTEHRCFYPVAILNLSINDDLVESSELECSLIFTVDSKKFTFTAPENIIWTGDDCVDKVFTPKYSCNYKVSIKWIGKQFVAKVGAF